MSEDNDILVSICTITYNQAKYIRECLDSLVMQKTNFKYEILIHDDASTDGTEEIIREYAEKYPEIIKPLYEKENQFSRGKIMQLTFNFPRVKGKYVAMCEGDDYWTDVNKLQKQVDFMEANPDYSICFHSVLRHFEDGIREDEIFPLEYMKSEGFTYENLLKYNFIQTNSVMYRWVENKKDFPVIPANIAPGDWYTYLFFAKRGKIKFLEDTMAVYRINSNGIWHNSYNNPQVFYDKNCFKLMNFYKAVYKNFETTEKFYIKNLLVYYKFCLKRLSYPIRVMFIIYNLDIIFNGFKFYCKLFG